jgi:hypothetical protein
MGWIYLSFKNMVEDDAKNFIVANFEDGTYDGDTDWSEVFDDMYDSDDVTGNASSAGHPDCFLVTYEPDGEKIANMFADEDIREMLESEYGDEVPWYEFVGHGQEGITKFDAWIRIAMLCELNDDLYKYFEQVQKDFSKEN